LTQPTGAILQGRSVGRRLSVSGRREANLVAATDGGGHVIGEARPQRSNFIAPVEPWR
jgi:hypothetical protein